MSIKNRTISEKSEDLARGYDFDNGDLQAIKNVMEKYRFLNEELMFRFALAVLLKAEKNGVYVDEGDRRIFLSPSTASVKPENEENVGV